MKRLTLIFCLLSSPAFAAITATSNVTCVQNTTTVTTCVGSAMTVSSNDVIVLYITAGVTTWTFTPTDTCSQTWTHQTGASVKTGVSITDAWTVTGATAGSCTITVTRAGTGGGKFSWVAENYAGVQKLGNTATTSGGSTSTSASISITTQDINNFVVAAFSSGTKITLTGTAGTLRGQINGSATMTIGLSDNTSGSAGSVTDSVSFSAAASFTSGAIELRSSSTGRAAVLSDETFNTLMNGSSSQTYTLPNTLLSSAWCTWVMPTGSTANTYSIAVQSPSTLNGQAGTIVEPTYQMSRICQDASKNYWMRPPIVAGTNMAITNSATATTINLVSTAAPTISSGFGTTPSIPNNNGPSAFTINVGTGGTATSGVIGLPAATAGWSCQVTDRTNNTVTRETATTTTLVTLTAAAAWAASDILQASCFPY